MDFSKGTLDSPQQCKVDFCNAKILLYSHYLADFETLINQIDLTSRKKMSGLSPLCLTKAIDDPQLTAWCKFFSEQIDGAMLDLPSSCRALLTRSWPPSCMSDIHLTLGSRVEQLFFSYHRAVCFSTVNQILRAHQFLLKMLVAPNLWILRLHCPCFPSETSTLPAHDQTFLETHNVPPACSSSAWHGVRLKVRTTPASGLQRAPLCSSADVSRTQAFKLKARIFSYTGG